MALLYEPVTLIRTCVLVQKFICRCANRSRSTVDHRTPPNKLCSVHPPSTQMPPSKYDKAKQEKNEAFKDLLKALEAQDGELTDRIERTEEKVLNLEARNQKDSQPVVSVFADLARQAAWST